MSKTHVGYTIRHRYVNTAYLDPYCKVAYPSRESEFGLEPRQYAKMPSELPRVYWTIENAQNDLKYYAQRPDDWEVVLVEVMA